MCWEGEKVLAGTKDGEVFEVAVQDRENPKIIVQVSDWREYYDGKCYSMTATAC